MRIETLHEHFLKSSGICTDTRKIKPNCLFFALRGDNFNANEFTEQAIEAGAYKVVIDDLRKHQNTGKTILTKDSLTLLQKLATYHRNYLNIPIVGLTGSNGKTTTKELINVVLSKKFKTTATLGNLNNHIGVPLTLLSMNKETEMGIVEMGANHLKEIELLSSIAQPSYGYITNFGKAHLEGFGGIEGVIKGKTELYKFLKENNKKVFVNGNDPKQMELSSSIDRFTFGNEQQDCNVKLIDASQELIVSYKDTIIKSNLIGIYNFHNISAAIAMGHYFDISANEIKNTIEGYIPTNNRSQQISIKGHRIILDAYNANPTSMMAALENFKQAEGDSKILFLGDMFELGEDASKEHQAITSYIEEAKIGKVFLIGENFYKTNFESDDIQKLNSFEALKKLLPESIPNNSFMLIKASRGMALERIIDLL